MQDRFKFRVWNKKNKKMYNVDSLHLDSKDGEWVWTHYYNPIYDKDLKIQIEKNFELMQCTGLEDKNGKLIYGGDILLEKNGKHHIVKWNNNHATFFIEQIEKTGRFDTWHLARHDLDYEAIGNIYENKELLNE